MNNDPDGTCCDWECTKSSFMVQNYLIGVSELLSYLSTLSSHLEVFVGNVSIQMCWTDCYSSIPTKSLGRNKFFCFDRGTTVEFWTLIWSNQSISIFVSMMMMW